MVQVLECLIGKHKALSSNPNTTKVFRERSKEEYFT
jgi:hypothetical protein